MNDMTASRSGAPDGSYGELARLAAPNILSRLGVMAMGLTDAIVVGQYSAVDLGYHALGWAPTAIVLVAGIGLLQGIQVLTARHLGAGRPDKTGAVLRRGLSYATILGVLATALMILAGPWMMGHIGLEPDLARGASAALVIFSLSLVPYLVADCFWLWLEAHGKARVPMMAMWAANIVNLLLCLWIVPGHSPFPVEGAIAAGWVTLVARLSLLGMLAVYVWRWSESRRLGVFDKAPYDPDEAREQRRIGYASGLSYAIEAGAFSGMNFVAAQLGVLAVASWAIVMNITASIFMIPMGIATATAIFVSRSVGAQDIQAVRRSWRMGLTMSFAILLLVSVLVFWDPAVIAGFYNKDPDIIAITTGAMLLACIYFLPDGAQVVSASSLRARGDVWWPTGMHAISYLGLMIPLGWYLGVYRQGGIEGIVWAVIIASMVSGVALSARFLALGDKMKQGDA